TVNAMTQNLNRDPVTGFPITPDVVTNDGFAVNTIQPSGTPHAPTASGTALLPYQKFTTIGDRLSEKNLTWAWYAGGWNDAAAAAAIHAEAGVSAATDAGAPPVVATISRAFQYHHQPFNYFENFKDGTQAKADHLKDETDMTAAIAAGMLPAVTFWKPVGIE